MVGQALCRRLEKYQSLRIVTATRNELDLTNQFDVRSFFSKNKIDEIYMAAAKVGGIKANIDYPASFIYENLMIEANIIEAAHRADVQKLLFLGSSCIYPKLSPQPINEKSLLSGLLESSNEPYAIAKIVGIKLCESFNRQYKRDYRSLMPTNLYGPGDNFDLESSHVVPAVIRKLYEACLTGASSVTFWGSGKPRREFLHVDDMASASVHVMNIEQQNYFDASEQMNSHINVGTGVDLTISELVKKTARIIGFGGEIFWDTSKPDGTQRKRLDVSRLKSLGWNSSIDLDYGLDDTFRWYIDNRDVARV